MNIDDLETEINFILSRYNDINPCIHFPIEVYSNNYNDIFEFWENNKKSINIQHQVLKAKIEVLVDLKKTENTFIKLTCQLEEKFNNKKINSKLNTILKIITFGCFDLNKKIEKKITILKTIKQIKQQNLVKISELIWRINNQKPIESINLEKNVLATSPLKATLS